MTRFFTNWKIGRRIFTIPILFAAGSMVTLFMSWHAHNDASKSADALNLSGRQRMLNQRHCREVIASTCGDETAYHKTRDLLMSSASSLLNGGPSDFNEQMAATDLELRRLLELQIASLETAFSAADALLADPQNGEARALLVARTDAAHKATHACVLKIQDNAGARSANLLFQGMGVGLCTAMVCGCLAAFISKSVVGEVTKSALSLRTPASQDMRQVTSLMEQNAGDTTHQATLASGAAEQVSSNAQAPQTAVEEFNASIQEISGNTSDAATVARQAVDATDQTNVTVTKLGESSAEIGNVIKVINSIAEQTNLLALNATIEAARAGEAGKGFAVVANEVKELAKQTSDATEDIIGKIATIQADTGQAVEAITRVGEIIASINESQSAIASAVEEQSVMTGEISRNIDEVATGSEGIARSISAVADAASSTSRATEETTEKADSIELTATDLLSLVADVSSVVDAERMTAVVQPDVP